MPVPVGTAGGAMTTAPIVLLDLMTSDGLIGRSYVRTYTPVALRALAALLEDLADLVKGRPAEPEPIGRQLRGAVRLLGARGLVLAAIAGIDMALWDVQGKAQGRPLAALLHGASDVVPTDRVPAYASLRSRRPAAARDEAAAAAAAGFSAVKLKAGGAAWQADLELLAAVRSGVEESVAIMVDYNQSLTVDAVLARAGAIDELGLAWIEEPTRADDFEGHARVAAALSTPVQLGENLDGPDELRLAMSAAASDLVMFDAVRIGGVSGWMRAAQLAHEAQLPISSHTYPEFSVHLLSASRTHHWLEHLDHVAPILLRPLEIRDGYAVVPSTPGVSLEWDERAIARVLG
jgi:mandelate racemase